MHSDLQITKLVRKNVVEEIYKQILNNIEQGILKEGDKLPTENELCKMLNVSRVSVRNAMQRLKDKNLILSKQGLGYFVTEPSSKSTVAKEILISEKEYIDVVNFRKAVEFRAIDLIAENTSDEELECVRIAVEGMCNCGDFTEKYVEYDYNFHFGIIKASKNEVFVSVFEHIHDLFYRYLLSMANATVKHLGYGQNNHQNIYKALLNRDAFEAKRIILKSMDYNLARFYQ